LQLGLTREGDYAIRAMLALAAHEASAPLSSRRIAGEWRIPPRFLIQVLGRLADRGLVTGVIGRNGGYRLGRPAAEISLLDVVTAIEVQPIDRRCVLRGGPCLPDGSCLVHEAFTAARSRFLGELATRSLDTVLASSGWQPTVGARADG
jgi:Rrf2 family protein